MKDLLTKILPMFIIEYFQKKKLNSTLKKPYIKIPFSLLDVVKEDPKSSYASIKSKRSVYYKKIMRKLESYIGSGPIGPNKYWEYPWIISNLDLKEDLSILDAGCGRSPIQYVLADLNMKVSGIDPCENVGWHGIDRRLAKKYDFNIDYRVEGMEKISYEDESFDRVISVSVIEHCRAQEVQNELLTAQTKEDGKLQATMMKEMARVLKKGGLLVVTVDLIFPTPTSIAECNLDIANLIKAPGLELLGSFDGGVYGDDNFDLDALKEIDDLDIQDYTGVIGTSVGLVFQK